MEVVKCLLLASVKLTMTTTHDKLTLSPLLYDLQLEQKLYPTLPNLEIDSSCRLEIPTEPYLLAS